MPFKVVQTIEKGKLRLTAVPDMWEQNGVLFWPRNKQERLRKQETSTPDRTWTGINCLVKRTNISTFEEAEAEVDAMSDKSDTETDTENLVSKRLSRNYKNILPTVSFNNMAEKLSEIQSHQHPIQQEVIITEASYIPTVNTKNIFENQEQYIATSALSQPLLTTTEENNVQNINIEDQNYILVNHQLQIEQVQEDIKTIKEDVKKLLHNQNTLCELQNNLLFKLSEFQTQFEGYITLTSKSQPIQDPAITPIKNLNELEDFEKSITDSIIKDKLYKTFSVLCSKGPGKGMTNAYYLIDTMFERSFFLNCSWTGSSKGETAKICFKAFNKTIDFFFNVIHGTDETFTRADCDKFFKVILKNAAQRCESNQRTSTSRRRLKNKNNSDTTTSITTSTTTSSVAHEAPAATII